MLPSNPKTQSPARWNRRGARSGFTLVEIILAIGLATALLLIAMTFYHQAADIRGQILRESERLSTMRLVLDHLAGDLRAAQRQTKIGNEFTGDSTSLRFVKQALVMLPANAAPGTTEPTDLVQISILTLIGTNGTNVTITGLDRIEQPLDLVAFSSNLITNSVDISPYPPESANKRTEPFADMVRFVRFRYWDGSTWLAGWTNSTPPNGVEIVLATDKQPEEAGPEDYPVDAFRRVVFLPGGQLSPAQNAGITINDSSL